ncbi:hypothetical protein [Nocardia vulneris]|uniref:hypothetical protein n=1 Tax=Nocardia vulneris TaxID=1141657 RepID=UPI00068BBB9F|nr:hypothetical protein [Nocardia vulneris]
MNAQQRSRHRSNSSPLAAVRTAFTALADQPVELAPELRAGFEQPVPTWGRLRELVCDPGLPIVTVDAVWRWLIVGARRDDRDARLVCAGMALPMLAGLAHRFRLHGRADAESAVLAGFFGELARIDLDRPYLVARLRWAAYRSAHGWAQQARCAPIPDDELDTAGHGRGHRPIGSAPAGHPELLLGEAVAGGVISAFAAELIASTRLEHRSLASVALERGDSYDRLQQARLRAERKLTAWLQARAAELDPARTSTTEAAALSAVTLDPARAHRNRAPVSKTRRDPGVVSQRRFPAVPADPAHTEDSRRCA